MRCLQGLAAPLARLVRRECAWVHVPPREISRCCDSFREFSLLRATVRAAVRVRHKAARAPIDGLNSHQRRLPASFDPDAAAAAEARRRQRSRGAGGERHSSGASHRTNVAAALTRIPTQLCSVAGAARAIDGGPGPEGSGDSTLTGAPVANPSPVIMPRAPPRPNVSARSCGASLHGRGGGRCDLLGALGLDSTTAVRLIRSPRRTVGASPRRLALRAAYHRSAPCSAAPREQRWRMRRRRRARQGRQARSERRWCPSSLGRGKGRRPPPRPSVAPMRVGRPHYGAKNDAPTTLRILERDMRDDPATVTCATLAASACAAGDSRGARLAARGGWSAAHAIDKHGSTALMWAAS